MFSPPLRALPKHRRLLLPHVGPRAMPGPLVRRTRPSPSIDIIQSVAADGFAPNCWGACPETGTSAYAIHLPSGAHVGVIRAFALLLAISVGLEAVPAAMSKVQMPKAC